ncbi:MAG: hypothetical protein RBU30_20445 [Polyangia bacterium]|jgi:hypothetical protein|nr:hypothetical protein [Polyangia bacterium]
MKPLGRIGALQAMSLVLGVAVAGLLVSPRVSRAKNSIFYGDGAAISGGSGMAVYTGAGAAWYNPAGLVSTQRSQVDLSASLFILSLRDTSGLVETRLGGQTYRGDLDAVGFHSIPTSLVFKRRLSKRVHGALGVFVTDFDRYRVNHEILVEDAQGGDTGRYYQRTSIDHERQTYHLGLLLGIALSERVRLGLALYGVYSTYSYEYRDLMASHTQLGLSNSLADPFQWNQSVSAQSTIFGLQLVTGLQWEFVRNWHLGLTLRSPVYEAYHKNSLDEVVATVDHHLDGSGGGYFARARGENPGTELVAPAVVVLGLGYTVPKVFVGVEGELQLPIQNFQRLLDYSPQFNVRAGTRFYVSPRVALGFGFFTERTMRKGLHFIGDREMDFYGAVLGLKWRRVVALSDAESAKNLVLSTTVCVRYAYGVGSLQGYLNDLDSPSLGASGPIRRDHEVHETALYLGSSLYF